MREEIDPLDELQELDKWSSYPPFNLAPRQWPIPHFSPLRGPLHLQAKRAFCFTSGPGALATLKPEPILSVQSIGLYIGRCHATTTRLSLIFAMLNSLKKTADEYIEPTDKQGAKKMNVFCVT